jgi:hypothetical protein
MTPPYELRGTGAVWNGVCASKHNVYQGMTQNESSVTEKMTPHGPTIKERMHEQNTGANSFDPES